MTRLIQESSKNATDRLDFMANNYNMGYTILSDNENLSNGDKVEIELIYDKKSAAEYGIAFKNTKFTYKIAGLKEPKVMDPFEGLEIEYIGVSPQASVTFNKTGCDKFINDNVDFTTESNTIANGESIVVKAYYDSQKTDENGIVLSPEEKTFEVSGVQEYPIDISKSKLTDVEKQFRDTAESTTANQGFTLAENINGYEILDNVDQYYYDEWQIKSIEYIPVKKMYFYAKDIKNDNIKNNYYILWEVKITAEKTGNDKWSKNSNYNIGDKFTVSQYVETYCQNFSADSDGVVNIENSNFGSQYYKKDKAEAIASKWKSQNVARYNVTELK